MRTEPLRVGYVVKRYPRYSETFIVNEILAHEAAGVEIEIISLRPPVDTHFQDRIARVRAPVHYLPPESAKASEFWAMLAAAGSRLSGLWTSLPAAAEAAGGEVYQAAALASLARKRGIGHLHAHFATAATGVARLAAGFAGLSYTFTAHAKDIFHDSVRPDDLRLKLRQAAATVTVSDYNAAYLREVFGEDAGRVERIYNGLDLERFPFARPQSRAPRIVAVGRLTEKKGFADLIEACALLAARGRTFDCQLIGGGELEADLDARIKRLGLADRVKLLGPRPQDELVDLVQNAAVFAAPCIVGGDGNRDGLPTVLLEAMALGTPCVSTDVTGIPEVVHEGETGLVVAQHDPPRLAAAIAGLLDDAPLRVRLAEQARRLIEREFNIQHNTERLRALFRDAAGRAADCPAADFSRPLLREVS